MESLVDIELYRVQHIYVYIYIEQVRWSTISLFILEKDRTLW